MSRENILERLGKVINESSEEDVDWNGVTEDTELESFGFDSLTVLDLIFDLDQEFGTKIEATEILKMNTVGDLVTYLQQATTT